jgi:tRNA A37 methylthiotransferase MiaB
MPKKLYIKTFGCQMNEYDSDKMADVLNADHPVVATADPAQARCAKKRRRRYFPTSAGCAS